MSAARRPRCSAATNALMPAGYYTLAVPPLLRTESPQPLRRTPRRARTLHRRLPHGGRFLRHGAQSLRPPAAARAGPGDGPRGYASKRCSKLTGSTACSTSRFRPICVPAASAWRRIACRSPVSIEDAAPDELDAAHRDLGHAGAGRRPRRRGHPGGRRRQPLDQGRGRGQGAQSVLQTRRTPSQLHRSASGQEPACRPRVRHAACRTSSPRAI